MSRPRLPLLARILGIVSLSLVPCLLIVLRTATLLEERHRAELERELGFIAGSVAGQERMLLASVAQGLRGTAEAPPIQDGDPEEARRVLLPLRETNPYFRRMSLRDREGRILASSDPEAGPADAPQPWTEADSLPRGGFRLGPLERRPGGRTLVARMPVRGRAGFAGHLEAELELERHGDFVAFAGLPEGAVVELGDRNGELLFRHPSAAAAGSGAGIDRELWELARRLPEGEVYSRILGDGAAVLASSAGVDGDGDGFADLRVVASLALEPALRPLRAIMAESYLLIALAAALSLGIALVLARLSVVRRVRLILARGAEPRKGGRDELEELDLALAAMDEALGAREEAAKRSEESLRGALGERELLLRELHHRVYNTFQVVLSLLRIEAAAAGSEETRAILRGSEARIKSMALVHERLYEAESLDAIEFAGYAARLARELHGARAGLAGRVELRLDLSPVHVDLAQAIPLGLILNELLTEVLDHAFPGGRVGSLTLGLAPAAEGRLRLSVADEGEGPPPRPEGGGGQALGLHLADNLAAQLGAALRRERGAKGGSTTLEFAPFPKAGERG